MGLSLQQIREAGTENDALVLDAIRNSENVWPTITVRMLLKIQQDDMFAENTTKASKHIKKAPMQPAVLPNAEDHNSSDYGGNNDIHLVSGDRQVRVNPPPPAITSFSRTPSATRKTKWTVIKDKINDMRRAAYHLARMYELHMHATRSPRKIHFQASLLQDIPLIDPLNFSILQPSRRL
jgi:hypothetical protein